jgi:hypothetical protein
MEALKDKALALDPLRGYSLSVLNNLLQELESDKQRLIDEKACKELTKYGLAIQHVTRWKLEAEKRAMHREKTHEVKVKLQQIQDEIHAYDDETQEILRNMEEYQKEQKESMMKAHQKEIQSHLELWKSDEKMRHYNRASADLGNRKFQFEKYLRQERWEEAKVLGDQVEVMERKEAVRAAELYKSDYKESLKRLRVRQMEQVQTLDASLRNEKEAVLRKRQGERAVLLNVQKKNELKGSAIGGPENVWNRNRLARYDEIRAHAGGDDRAQTWAGASTRSVGTSHQAKRPNIILPLPPLELERC